MAYSVSDHLMEESYASHYIGTERRSNHNIASTIKTHFQLFIPNHSPWVMTNLIQRSFRDSLPSGDWSWLLGNRITTYHMYPEYKTDHSINSMIIFYLWIRIAPLIMSNSTIDNVGFLHISTYNYANSQLDTIMDTETNPKVNFWVKFETR